MDLRDTLLRVYECGAPAAALRAVASSLSASLALRRAVWLGEDGAPLLAWPDGARLSPALAGEAAAAARPSVVPLRLRFPDEAADLGDAEALLLPLRADAEAAERVVLVAPAGRLGCVSPTAWSELGAAFARVAARDRALRTAEGERDTLRQRAEESEALHVLGLAANRTLDPDEVLTLVARFTRTLLGAHYVTVHTAEDGRIRTVASVGLRSETPAEDPFAARVTAARKPLELEAPPDGEVDEPVHAAEGMRTGLGVPLSLFGETFGALVIGYRRPYALHPRDTRLALTLAGHAAVAISNARLHGALAQRTRETERANEELRWTTEAKDRFFASVSHELRTPLNAILGYHSLLLEGVPGELPPPMRTFLEKAQRATQNLLHLVNDVLDLSKLDAGKMELVIQPVRVRAIVEEALATVEPMAAGKGIEVSVDVHAPLPLLHTDADRVRQILVNLLSNAVKFTDAGRVWLVLALDDEAAPQWLEIRVEDTGHGIAPENHERIFHEFEQIAGATTRGGTGLGLPISRKLARLLGGDIHVESRLGEGARFTLRLPAAPR